MLVKGKQKKVRVPIQNNFFALAKKNYNITVDVLNSVVGKVHYVEQLQMENM